MIYSDDQTLADFSNDDNSEFSDVEDDDDEDYIMKRMMEEARTDPIWFPDGSSTQDILPLEEQWYPKDKHGKDEIDYAMERPVTPEREAEVDELIRKMKEEGDGPFSNNWVNPAKKNK